MCWIEYAGYIRGSQDGQHSGNQCSQHTELSSVPELHNYTLIACFYLGRKNDGIYIY